MEKPFSCNTADCNMSFVNEDHLTVHKKKHEFSLSLAPPPTFKNLVDQTPTPTRFLNALESLEFENPFDATFRRANSTGASSSLDIPDSSALIDNLPDSEVLNTPSITLPSEPATPITLKPNFLKKRSAQLSSNTTVTSENIHLLPFTSSDLITGDDLSTQNQTITQSSTESNDFINISLPQSSQNFAGDENSTQRKETPRNVLQTSVITSVGNSSTNLKANSVGVPTAVVVTRPITISNVSSLTTSQVSLISQQKIQEVTPAAVQPVCVSAPVVQLMIRLPDGQTVQLPIMTSTPSTQPAAKIVSQVSSTTSNTKKKLKEVLTSNKRTIRTTVFKETPQILSDDSFGSVSSPPLSPLMVSKHQGRKRRDISDPEEKKKRCLERNRAAATRCREKRKVWINSLEQKADELAVTNIQLQLEVKQLRKEVSNLKTMLLAHKDCPVTMQQQQRAHTYEPEKEPCPVIHLISSSPEAIQQVPNSSDYLEIEVNSVQSSSDTSSLTSDASELSYKER